MQVVTIECIIVVGWFLTVMVVSSLRRGNVNTYRDIPTYVFHVLVCSTDKYLYIYLYTNGSPK